ncbi:DUF418 domain-containing protein [Bacillus sp. 2205SS5-2]|uniref:DUF418 domain-containing protein n=1 Tax=Bacillus sp. 2205SS5-2 TaxID=3109031 RepID=UPI0030049150
MEPVKKSARIDSLDMMRGFALLGIFLVNMISFHSPIFHYNPYQWWEGKGEENLYMFIDVLVQASFYPLFAMLFGYGLAIQRERALTRGVSFLSLGIRRLSVLLVFGLIHALFIWSGDILTNYALFGLLLIGMMRWSGKTLLISGALLFFIPQLLISSMFVILYVISPNQMLYFTDIQSVQEAFRVYSSGNYAEIFSQRFQDWFLVNRPLNLPFLLLAILPMMMIGAGASKEKLLENAHEKKGMWVTILLISLVVGLGIKLLPFIIETNYTFTSIQDFLGGPFLSVAYAATIILISMNGFMNRILQPLAKAGKMSLTLYLTQSIIGTLIFYSYGLGLYGEVTLTTGTWLVFVIFFIQVIIAEIWLSRFQYGPMEKLWRTLTYGKIKKRGTT